MAEGTVYDGNFQSASWEGTSMKVISSQLPEGILDDPTPTTTAATGAAHGQVAGSRVKYGNIKLVVAYDTAVMDFTMGSADGTPSVGTLELAAVTGGNTVAITFEDCIVLSKRTPSELALGNNQPSIELEFQFHAPTGVVYPAITVTPLA